MLKISKYRQFIVLLTAVFIASCATQKEISTVVIPVEKEIKIEKETAPPKKEVIIKEDKRPDKIHTMRCEENTATSFNISGMKVLPFIKPAFFDMNGDGLTDMIAGSKNGMLYLYQNSGDTQIRYWKTVEEYFDGISAGAFSSPAVGDIDSDGQAELIVGTGGFSSDSGRLLFFKNTGSIDAPKWVKIEGTDIKIGNDAAVTMVDYNFDGLTDLIAGNSEGKIFFFKNISTGKNIRFVPDKSLQLKKSFDKYAVPSAVKLEDRVILTIGTSLGKLYMFELEKGKSRISEKNIKADLFSKRFLSPAFTNLLDKTRFDLVIADGDGIISYYENKNKDFTVLVKNHDLFNNRIFAGPACAPSMSFVGNRFYMVVGNIDGRLKLYEFRKQPEGLPWIEKKGYFDNIKVSGFSRGVFTTWKDKGLLITGESSGDIKAFVNNGSEDLPSWKQEKNFFKGLQKRFHSTPTVFDIDNDGTWELITGAEDGRIYAYKLKEIKGGLPFWEEITVLFDNIKVKGFSAPTFLRDNRTIYLFVGQEDGKIRTYTSELRDENKSHLELTKFVFFEREFIPDIRMQNHSSPFLIMNNGIIEMISGDYDGNIRHFNCIQG
jgi:hypothetical protein